MHVLGGGGGLVDGGAAEGAGVGGALGLEPWQRAAPVEAVAARQVRQDVARGELFQADGRPPHRISRLITPFFEYTSRCTPIAAAAVVFEPSPPPLPLFALLNFMLPVL